MPVSELKAIADIHFAVLSRFRKQYPSLRDDQLLMAMFILEHTFEMAITDMGDHDLFSLTSAEIAQACS